MTSKFKRTVIIILLLSAGIISSSFITAGVKEHTLKNIFEGKFAIGVAINRNQAQRKDAKADSLLITEFNSISPENDLKWEHVHPQPDRYNFEPADAYVALGTKRGMLTVGHTLVWHSQTPDWVFKSNSGAALNREQLLQRLKDHITTVVSRYKGKIKGWDVVNEALNEDGSLRKSKWYSIIGEDYIEKAFEYAHAADPDAELYYNDYNLCKPEKRAGAVILIKRLLKKGIPVTAVGEQAHYSLTFPDVAEVETTIDAFSALGVHVNITELDINVLPEAGSDNTAEVSKSIKYNKALNPYTNGLPENIQQRLAVRYSSLFSVFVKHHSVIDRITFWGLTDADSWLNNWPVQGRTNYPLPFNRGYTKKALVYNAIAESAR